MAQYILKNLTNSPQMIGAVRVAARGTSEPIELDDLTVGVARRLGIFAVKEAEPTPDPFAGLDDGALRLLYETTTGKKAGRLGRAKMLAALNG